MVYPSRAVFLPMLLVLSACPPPPAEPTADPEPQPETTVAAPQASPAAEASTAGVAPPPTNDGAEAPPVEPPTAPIETPVAQAYVVPTVSRPECAIPPEADDEAAQAAGAALERTTRKLERLQFESRTLRSLGTDLSEFKDELVKLAKEITTAGVALVADHPCATV